MFDLIINFTTNGYVGLVGLFEENKLSGQLDEELGRGFHADNSRQVDVLKYFELLQMKLLQKM